MTLTTETALATTILFMYGIPSGGCHHPSYSIGPGVAPCLNEQRIDFTSDVNNNADQFVRTRHVPTDGSRVIRHIGRWVATCASQPAQRTPAGEATLV